MAISTDEALVFAFIVVVRSALPTLDGTCMGSSWRRLILVGMLGGRVT